MGLDRQPNDFSCGPWALKHALNVLGIIADPARLARIAKTHWWSGTDEVRLARAARAHDCDMPLIRRFDPDEARKVMVKHLRDGYPVLTCVDGWEHWITIVNHSKGKFVCLDSRGEPVVLVLDWKQLEERWACEDEDEDGELVDIYDMFPVKPRFRREVHAHFTVARARALRRPENRDLALCWDRYVPDLLEICRPRSPLHVEPLTVGELIRRNRDILIGRVCYWHGGIERDQVQRVLRNLRFVADTYGMVVPAASTRRALAELAILLTLWAAGHSPVDPLYVPEPKPRRRRNGAKKKKK